MIKEKKMLPQFVVVVVAIFVKMLCYAIVVSFAYILAHLLFINSQTLTLLLYNRFYRMGRINGKVMY